MLTRDITRQYNDKFKGACASYHRSGLQLPEIYVNRHGGKEKDVVVEEADKEEEFAPITKDDEERKETSTVRARSAIKAYVQPIPFSQRLQKKKLNKHFAKFVKIFKKLHINIPFANAIAQMSGYTKFFKEILSNKRKLEEHEIIYLDEKYSTIFLKKLPPKLKDP